MAIKKLTVENAQIKTASVEVKTLTISGKQVTLAVFRQLFEENLIDPGTCQLQGIPWGIINYHPDKCSESSPHLHVVWQKGDDLRRNLIWRSPSVHHSAYSHELNRFGDVIRTHYNNLSVMLAAVHLQTFQETGAPAFDLASESGGGVLRGGNASWSVTFQKDRMHHEMGFKSLWGIVENLNRFLARGADATIYSYSFHGDNNEYINIPSGSKSSRDEVIDAFRNRIGSIVNSQAVVDIVSEYDQSDPWPNLDSALLSSACQKALEARRQAESDKQQWLASYNGTYKQLEALDQLFIAV